VSERQWHPSQKLKPLAGERVELSLELSSLREIERWVLSWGPRVEVLAPHRCVQHAARNGALQDCARSVPAQELGRGQLDVAEAIEVVRLCPGNRITAGHESIDAGRGRALHA